MRILAAGGTIAMVGGAGATPQLDAQTLVDGIEALSSLAGLEAETVVNVPSAHLTLSDQLLICRAARDAARQGIGVVVTHGTDTLEETAMLCDVIHDADAPIVFTGAIRVASAPGADGPANLLDAVSVAASAEAAGMGVLVVFGGEIHHARCARKTDTTSLTAFSSPQTGPARPRDRGPRDLLVAAAAQRAARPAGPRQARADRPDRLRGRRDARPRGAGHRAGRHGHRDAGGRPSRAAAARALGARRPSACPSSPTAGPSAASS